MDVEALAVGIQIVMVHGNQLVVKENYGNITGTNFEIYVGVSVKSIICRLS